MKIILNPSFEHLGDFVRKIPDIFQQEGKLIYEGRNQLKEYEVDGLDIVVKSFKKPHLLNRFIYTFFRPSKAKRSYEYAFELERRKVPTPAPIAYIEEKKKGLLKRSYYISIFQKEYDHIRFYMNGNKDDSDLMKNLAVFIADFHSKGVYHLDMSPGNILFKKEGDKYYFTVIDINRMRFKESLEKEERFESFRRLCISKKSASNLAREYAKASGLDEKETVDKIVGHCARFFHSHFRA